MGVGLEAGCGVVFKGVMGSWQVDRSDSHPTPFQDRLVALEREMAARDQLEGEIDGKMVALFNRLKQLEDANLSLEQAS